MNWIWPLVSMRSFSINLMVSILFFWVVIREVAIAKSGISGLGLKLNSFCKASLFFALASGPSTRLLSISIPLIIPTKSAARDWITLSRPQPNSGVWISWAYLSETALILSLWKSAALNRLKWVLGLVGALRPSQCIREIPRASKYSSGNSPW